MIRFWLWLKRNFGIIIIAVLAAGFFSTFQLSNIGKFPDPDGFYHARIGLQLWQGELKDRLPSLHYTILREGYADQHYLYHAMLGLLLQFFPYPYGLHVSIILFGTAAVVAWALLLRSWQVKMYGLWIVVLLGTSADFLFRLNVPKANAISLVALAGIIAALDKQKFWLLFPLSFLFVWLYGGFVFIPVLVGAFLVAWFWQEKKLVVKPVFYSLAGLVLGLVIHPHASHLPNYLYHQIFQTGLAAGLHIAVGNEWNPYEFQVFSQSNPLIGIITIGALLLFFSQWKKWQENYDKPARLLAIGLLHLFFLLLAIRSRRFVEYWVPFSVLFSALVFSPYLKKLSWQKFSEAFFGFWQFRFICVIITSILILAPAMAISDSVSYFKDGTQADLYRGAANYLSANARPEDIIVNDKWDQYPQLFYWYPQGRYIVGLDPIFMYAYDPELYRLWNRLSYMKAGDYSSVLEINQLLREKFAGQYLFVEKERSKELISFLASDSDHRYFELVYEDDKTILYKVVNTK